MKNPNKIIKRSEVFSYASLNFGHSLLMMTVSTYMLYYLTDIAQLSPVAIPILLFIVRFFDGAIDPFIGVIIDRRQTRFGKYKGYLVYWTIPFCLLTVLLFSSAYFNGRYLLLYIYVIYLLWSFSYSMIEGGSLSLLSAISNDTNQRKTINTFKIAASIIAVAFVNYFLLTLTNRLGNGDKRLGFAITICLFSCIALAAMLPCIKLVKERNVYHKNSLPLKETLSTIARDKKLHFFLLMYLFQQIAAGVKAQATIYYMEYYVNRIDLAPLFLLAGILSSLAAQPFIAVIARKVHTLRLTTIAYCLSGLFMLIMGLFGTNLFVLMSCNILYGICVAFPSNLVYSYAADLSEGYAKEKKGSFSATINSLIGLSSRFGDSIAGSVIALILLLTRYSANEQQSTLSLFGIQFSFIILTLTFLLFAALFSFLSYRQQMKVQVK